MIKIAIADDHPMVIQGIKQMLDPFNDIMVESMYSDGNHLLEGLNHKQPHVLLLDLQMPGIKGDEIALKIQKNYSDVKIIAVTNFDSQLYIQNMFRNGAHGYLLKTTDQQTLAEAIRTVNAGSFFIEPCLREKARQAMLKNDKSKYLRLSLTLREVEIVRLLLKGMSNKEIAAELFISYHTMRNHRARIFLKFDVSTMGELVKKAIESGF